MHSLHNVKINCSRSVSSAPILILSKLTAETGTINIDWGQTTALEIIPKQGQAINFTSVYSICRFLARTTASSLYGNTILEKTEVDHWLEFCSRKYSVPEFKVSIQTLDTTLSLVTFLVGDAVTLADICVWSLLYGHKQFQGMMQENAVPPNVKRWFSFLSSQPAFYAASEMFPQDNQITEKKGSATKVKMEDKGKFVDLPGAEMGKVVVRFPPEASGYLHIGHAKAALLNAHYQISFNGKLVMRFDDTNPEKEKEDFEKVILEDVSMLQIKPDIFTYTSDHFEFILKKCEELLTAGVAYVDDTEPETMKNEREQRQESRNRNNDVKKNLSMWEEMKKGTDYGKSCCVRAKIDMASDNGCLRDPTMYRCKDMPHPRTGGKYKVYPTYDFACPIVDSIEGVTHALRTTEYHDRDEQFFWFIDVLKLRKPYIYEYSRLNMTNTVLSKRKLTWFVNEGIVDGWDDPRMPTVRGVLRRGMTVEGLKQFIVAQGSSRAVVVMEWDKIWAFNKKVIDPIAPRYNAVEKDNCVPVIVEGGTQQTLQVAKHPKNSDLGMKDVTVGPRLLVDVFDAEAMKVGENVTFINWGNLLITAVNKKSDGNIESINAKLNLDNKDFKKTLKVTWVIEDEKSPLTPCMCVYYDHLVSKPVLGKDDDFKKFMNKNTKVVVNMMGDADLTSLKKGDIIQIQRKGFFICDEPYDPSTLRYTSCAGPVVLFYIPDGSKDSSSLPNAVKKVYGKEESLKEKMTSLKGKDFERSPQEEEKSFCLSQGDVSMFQDAVDSGDNTFEAAMNLDNKIKDQGNLVRKLKSEKAEKSVLDANVQQLLKLKGEFKVCTGKEWSPNVKVSEVVQKQESTKQSNKTDVKKSETSALDLSNKIKFQGDVVRKLKSEKADKTLVDSGVQQLLKLKAEFKTLTGMDWKPDIKLPAAESKVIKQKDSKSELQPVDLDQQIRAQGDQVRKLKSEKAEKALIDSSVQQLLKLKAEFKALTGKDWKPDVKLAATENRTTEPKESKAELQAVNLDQQIRAQGDQVRKLKSEKADKTLIDASVQQLLKLKAEFKSATSMDWKPDMNLPATEIKTVEMNCSTPNQTLNLDQQIRAQGDQVRKLKSEKAAKSLVDAEVQKLLDLKGEFKMCAGMDWKPDLKLQTGNQASELNDSNTSNKYLDIEQQIRDKGDMVRKLKSEKAAKSLVDAEVQKLLDLKSEFKKCAGTDWKPDLKLTGNQASELHDSNTSDKSLDIDQQIRDKGDMVRKLKADKADKNIIDANVKQLLQLKEEYKTVTGKDWKPEGQAKDLSKNTEPAPRAEKSKKSSVKGKPNEKIQKTSNENPESVKKITRLGLEVKKEDNLAEWYSQVLTKGEMIEYYDVSGCYILRPWAYTIWEAIQRFFDSGIKKLGVTNCYFPMFVSSDALEREKTHISDFAPEVAWVTKSGSSDLEKPIAIRPTSETVMYPSYAKWIRSHRDLPLRLNQWCSVVRWEFRNPQPFIRTREFLWQEGHTAFAVKEEAENEVHTILDLYAQVYENLLAIPVIRGRKTEKEKFAGADFTTTTEAYVPASGRGLQGATSHHLGQNFSKMFEITYEDPETNEKQFVYQNSWGLSTRTIGAMVMIHADNTGLVLPPRVAAHQVVIVPCGITATLKESEKDALLIKCSELETVLQNAGIAIKGDYRDNYSPGWKFNHWELKGVPIRIELGPKDMSKNQFVAVRRDTGEKITLGMDSAPFSVLELLDNIHDSLYAKAKKEMDSHLCISYDWSEFCDRLEKKYIIMCPFCGDIECEEQIKKESAKSADEILEPGAPSMGAKSLCIPFQQPADIKPDTKCINPSCLKKPINFTLFGRSY